MSTDCDVLICGLGPVGQLLALLLGRRGLSVIAVDQASRPHDLPRAAVIDDEVLRIFQSAGIRDRILEQSQTQDQVTFVPHHGPPYTLLEPDGTIHGQVGLASIHQPSMEKTIIEAALEQQTIDLRWGCRLLDIEQDEAGVTASIQPSGSADTDRISAKWAIGCDGGNSLVRQILGIEFGGSTFRQRWLVVDVTLERPLAKVRHPHFFGDPERPIVCLPMSPGRHRWEWMIHPGEDEAPFLDPESIRQRIEPWLEGEEATVERAVVYTFHHRTAARWRAGRILLAGDAAHLMPPFAGQGFSSGARDAANLAWKLDAVTGGAPESLLDTYEAERRPHVLAMSRLAVTLGRFVQTASRRVALARDLGLRTLDVTGISRWSRENIKPVPAYGDGAFATRPVRLAPLRGVGSQFPQPMLRSPDGSQTALDDFARGDWLAFTGTEADRDIIERFGIRALQLGHDVNDETGFSSDWMNRHEATWVILRPDQFVYALGSNETELRSALDRLRRDLGRAITSTATKGGRD